MILHDNAGEMGKYTVVSVRPDKIACFLYEYHDTLYTSLGLPAIPLDRSNISHCVHCFLRPDKYHIINMQSILCMYHMINMYSMQTD